MYFSDNYSANGAGCQAVFSANPPADQDVRAKTTYGTMAVQINTNSQSLPRVIS